MSDQEISSDEKPDGEDALPTNESDGNSSQENGNNNS